MINRILLLTIISLLFSCNSERTHKKKCQDIVKQKKEIVLITNKIIQTTPLLEQRLDGKVDTLILRKIGQIIDNACPDLVASQEFKEFSITMLLNFYINDIKYCNQTYDLLDSDNKYILYVLLQEMKRNNININNQEIFTSDEVFRLKNSINDVKSLKVKKFIRLMDSVNISINRKSL